MRRGADGGVLNVKNILIVGNSHIGALRAGFDYIEIPSSMKIQYVALWNPAYKELSISKNQLLYPERFANKMKKMFGLYTYPCIDDYDKILLVAGKCRLSLDLYSNDRRIPNLSSTIVREIVNNIEDGLWNSLIDAVEPSKMFFLGGPLISSAAHARNLIKKVPLLDQKSNSEHCLADCIREACHCGSRFRNRAAIGGSKDELPVCSRSSFTKSISSLGLLTKLAENNALGMWIARCSLGFGKLL